MAVDAVSATLKKIDLSDTDPANLKNFNQVTMPFRRESHSFVIGNRHYSLKTRIKRKFAVDVDFAKAVLLSSGYEALEYSIPMLDKNVRETGVAPDIIISAYTAMDFLHGKTPNEMAGFIRKFFTRLTSKYPRADLVVLQLMNTIEGMTRADRVASPTHPLSLITGKPKVLMCSEVLRVLKFGKAHNLYPDADSDTIDRAQKIMSEFIEVFESEVEMIQERRGPYEDFNGRFLYVAEEGIEEKIQDNLAADCIHLSSVGQEQLSNMLWGHMESFIAANEMADYDFNSLPEICEENSGRGYGRTFYCGFGSCAKKSKDVVNKNDREHWCRLRM